MGTTTRDGRIDHAGGRLSYMPALDGLRALAVIAVLLYHGNVSWARGGYFGVDAFFVLSGFLITSLLLGEWRSSQPRRPAGVLDAARPPPPPGRGPRRRRGRVVRGHGGPADRVAPVAPRRVLDARLRRELEPDLLPPVVLRAVRGAVAVAPRLVARDRRAVLPALAARRVRVAPRGSRLPPRARRDVRAPRHGFGRAHGRALPPGHRPVTRVLRHRHPRAVVAHRRAPRDAPRPAPRHRFAPRGGGHCTAARSPPRSRSRSSGRRPRSTRAGSTAAVSRSPPCSSRW